MDNISKAITIAGSVLISVLIITVCMSIYNSYVDFSTKQASILNARDILSFNTFFLAFDNQIYGYEVYNLMGKVLDINIEKALGREIDITFDCGIPAYNLNKTTDIDSIRTSRNQYFYFTENLYDYPSGDNKQFDFSYTVDISGYIDHIIFTKIP